jgi:hypothetical protein
MTKNKFFRGAIGRPETQEVLKAIYESNPSSPGLSQLLIVAWAYSQSIGVELSKPEIFELIKNAQGNDLEIVLGTYEGEIPDIHKNYD